MEKQNNWDHKTRSFIPGNEGADLRRVKPVGATKVRNFICNNEVPNSGSQILSPTVRNLIFNNEVPKSEVTTVRNFIVNNEVLNSGNQISCPKVLEKAIVNFHIELL